MTEAEQRRESVRQAARARRRRRRERQRRGLPRWAWGPVGLLVLALLVLGGGAGAAYGVYRSIADDLVEPEAILATQRALGTSKVFDRAGEEGTLLFQFADPLSGLRNPVKIDEVSQNVINATVATEDASFFENEGVNLRGLTRAAFENLGLGSGDFLGGSGGSSITQQLVKNVLIAPEERTQRSVERKLKETILAIELTEKYPKEQVLEWYLNTIFYGNLSYGIGAASARYFGKPASDLTLAEAALLAGLPQAPAIYDPFTNPSVAKQRQAQVLDLMVRHGYISPAEANAAKAAPLSFANQSFEILAPHFVFYVSDQVKALCRRGRIALPGDVSDCDDLLTEGGLRITTTLDPSLQALAETTLRSDLATFEEATGAHNASLVAIDPETGEILAMVGSRDFFREDIDGQVNLATALNSPGSAFKPITYAAAFVHDPKQWNPATILWDVPLQFTEPDGTIFEPENFDGIERGPVPVRSALANSMNVPAFRVAEALGIRSVLEFAHRVGITTMENPDNYGPAITLGGGDVTLLDLTYAYSVFANNGVMRGQRSVMDVPAGFRELDPIAIKEIRDAQGRLLFREETPEERAVAPATQAYQITDILSDNTARGLLYGPNSTLVLDRPAAAKTGTAGDPGRNDVRRDFWTVGYTPSLVTGVWVGNADNEPMTGGTSSRTAGLIWHDFMLAAHADRPAEEFTVPAGLTIAQVYIPRLRALLPGEDRRALRAQNPCSGLTFELFVAEGGVPDRENTICRELEVNALTLQEATPETDAALVVEGFFLVPPIAPGQTEPDPEIIKWLRFNKVRFVDDDAEGAAVTAPAITIPREGVELGRGLVLVQGSANTRDLLRWSLSVALGVNPPADAFQEITALERRIKLGQLGRWDTRTLSAGPYVLRLTIEDDLLGELVIERRVTVKDAEPPTRVAPGGDAPSTLATPDAEGNRIVIP